MNILVVFSLLLFKTSHKISRLVAPVDEIDYSGKTSHTHRNETWRPQNFKGKNIPELPSTARGGQESCWRATVYAENYRQFKLRMFVDYRPSRPKHRASRGATQQINNNIIQTIMASLARIPATRHDPDAFRLALMTSYS